MNAELPGRTDPVRSVTAFDIVTCRGVNTLREMAEMMSGRAVGFLLVTREGSVAVVSERDIVRALADGEDPDDGWAVDVMSRDALMVSPDTAIEDAAELMLEANVRHLVVDDPDHERYGVVSIRDLVGPLLAG